MKILNETKVNGKIKKIVKVKTPAMMSDDCKLKQMFSGWYIPKESTLIYFNFAYHRRWMNKFWPCLTAREIDNMGLTEPVIKEKDKGTDKIIKKYKDKIKKLKDFKWDGINGINVDYDDLYALGWMRINLHGGELTITHDSKNTDAAKNLLLWCSEQKMLVSSATIYDNSHYTSIDLTGEEFKELAATINTKNVTGDLIDQVRNQMFGPGFYTDEKITFADVVNFLLEKK
jgi:hypothetical protein